MSTDDVRDETTKRERNATRQQTNALRRNGTVFVPSVCQHCGEEGKLEAHHPDYRDAEQVDWLCKACHAEEHRRHGKRPVRPESESERAFDVAEAFAASERAGFTIAADVDRDAEDPATSGQLDKAPRRCVVLAASGQRCRASPLFNDLRCSLHAGRLTPADGGRGRALAIRRRQARAERITALQRMGTRSVVAEALVAEAEQVYRAVTNLTAAAAQGDIAAAKALVPWLNQALGNPTERLELAKADNMTDLTKLSSQQLRAMLEESRNRAAIAAAEPNQAGPRALPEAP